MTEKRRRARLETVHLLVQERAQKKEDAYDHTQQAQIGRAPLRVCEVARHAQRRTRALHGTLSHSEAFSRGAPEPIVPRAIGLCAVHSELHGRKLPIFIF